MKVYGLHLQVGCLDVETRLLLLAATEEVKGISAVLYCKEIYLLIFEKKENQ